MSKKVSLIYGHGIGTDVVSSAQKIINATGADLSWEICDIPQKQGIPQDVLDSLARNKVALKGPLQTPVGYGTSSLNVALRKTFETYANIRPVRFLPGITSFAGTRTHPEKVNFTVVRENIEDLYAGIEHMQTPDVAQALKLITRQGCHNIIRYAFEYAHAHKLPTVHCATKANILKLTEGMMKRVFEEVACDYPHIQAEHIIVDNCAHQMVMNPEQFDLIVMTNMNGDILSDLASGLVGGLGLASSANIGDHMAMFEAVHGSAPDLAGTDKANPTALIMAGVMLLNHLGLFAHANRVEKALLKTLSQGKGTADLMKKRSGDQSLYRSSIRKSRCLCTRRAHTTAATFDVAS